LSYFTKEKTGKWFLQIKEEEKEKIIVNFIALRTKEVNKPGPMMMNIRRVINRISEATKIRNPFNGNIVARYVKMNIKHNTKRIRERKGVIPLATLLFRIWTYWGEPESWSEERLRVITYLSIATARMFRMGSIFSCDRDLISIDEKGRFMIMGVQGDKTDYEREGSRHCVWATLEKNPFNPVKLWRRYKEMTEERVEEFKRNRYEIVQKLANKEGSLYLDKTPIFWCCVTTTNKARPLAQTSMETQVRKLFEEMKLSKDHLRRRITPGSIRKSARMAARDGGLNEALLDAIGNWKQKTVGREHYEDFQIPENTSNIILQTERLSTLIEEETRGRIDMEYESKESERLVDREKRVVDEREELTNLGC